MTREEVLQKLERVNEKLTWKDLIFSMRHATADLLYVERGGLHPMWVMQQLHPDMTIRELKERILSTTNNSTKENPMETDHIQTAIRMLRDELNAVSKKYIERLERGESYDSLRDHEIKKMIELSNLIEKLKEAAK